VNPGRQSAAEVGVVSGSCRLTLLDRHALAGAVPDPPTQSFKPRHTSRGEPAVRYPHLLRARNMPGREVVKSRTVDAGPMSPWLSVISRDNIDLRPHDGPKNA
jgi:hypothetical protein